MTFLHHQLWPLSPTVAAGVPASAPVSAAWPIQQGWCDSFRVMIPSGHSGLTGIRILLQGQEIVPWSNNAWLVGSGETFTIPWDQEIMAEGLSVQMFNTDLVAHQFWLLADVIPTVEPAPATFGGAPPLATPPAATLSAVAALAG